MNDLLLEHVSCTVFLKTHLLETSLLNREEFVTLFQGSTTLFKVYIYNYWLSLLFELFEGRTHTLLISVFPSSKTVFVI